MARMTFLVQVDVKHGEYAEVGPTDVAHLITAAIYKTYANPMREDAGICAVLKIAHVSNDAFKPLKE